MKILTPPPTSQHPAKILLVDDDLSLLKLLALRIESAGHQVTSAASAAQALEELKHQKFDLVLSDLRMDNMNGLELYECLKLSHPNLPLVILTAHGTIPDAVAATRSGVAGFLTKPIDKHQLFKLIEELKIQQPEDATISQTIEPTAPNKITAAIPELSQARADFEKDYLINLLQLTQGKVSAAAKKAGRNRTDFYKLLNRHGLEAAAFKPVKYNQT